MNQMILTGNLFCTRYFITIPTENDSREGKILWNKVLWKRRTLGTQYNCTGLSDKKNSQNGHQKDDQKISEFAK